MMRVRVSRRAEMDLAEIADYIAADSPQHAYEFEDGLLEQARKLHWPQWVMLSASIYVKASDPALTAPT